MAERKIPPKIKGRRVWSIPNFSRYREISKQTMYSCIERSLENLDLPERGLKNLQIEVYGMNVYVHHPRYREKREGFLISLMPLPPFSKILKGRSIKRKRYDSG